LRLLEFCFQCPHILFVDGRMSSVSAAESSYHDPQMEMVLMVDKLQELRALRIQKLKKQG